MSTRDRFDLSSRVVVITGGAGLLGRKHAEAVLDMDGIPVLLDINQQHVDKVMQELSEQYSRDVMGMAVDITQEEALHEAAEGILARFSRLDALINNAANNPKMENSGETNWSRLENFPRDLWDDDLRVGLTGAFLCSKVFGAHMVAQGQGVILNIASDLAIIGPDQRIYRQPGLDDTQQPVKPVTYSVVKAGLIGLTRYLATYWADKGVRVNALSPGGVYAGQDDAFVQRLANLIPMGRMAHEDEYKAAVVFLLSDASSYMTGTNVVMEGGRTAW